jgi:hypothetical protein
MSQSIVPEVVRGLAHDPKSIARAIKWGLGINLLFFGVTVAPSLALVFLGRLEFGDTIEAAGDRSIK